MGSGEAAPRRVIWSVPALDAIDRIEVHIAKNAPRAARRVRLALIDAADSLERHPERGVRVRGNVRKLLALSPYVIRYSVEAGTVTILMIQDGRRRKA